MEIRKIIHTTTIRQSTITSLSTVINGGLGALFYFLLAKFLNSANYGAFSVVTTTIAMISGIVDLGCDQGLVRFIPKYKNHPYAQKQIAKLTLKVKLISGSIVIVLLTTFSKLISHNLLNQPSLSQLFPLIGLGVLTQLLFSFSTSFSQALEKFFLWGNLFIATNLIRLLLIVALFFSGTISTISTTFVYVSLPMLGFVFSLIFLDSQFLRVKGENIHLKEIFGFNKWVTAFIIVASVGSRLDIFFTARLKTLSDTGVYSLANQIVFILPQLTSAIGAVTSPKFSSFVTHSQNKEYTFKATLLTTTTAVLASIFLIPVAWFVFKFSGPDYQAGTIPFLVLLMAMTIFLINSPIRDSIIYYFSKPQFFFWQSIAHAIIIVTASLLLIPHFGITGSALAVLLGQIFIAISATWYFLAKSKQ